MSTVIVSAYYKIPSKQPHSFYTPHLQRWFRSVRAPVVFFTTADVRAEVESWGYPLSHIQFVDLPFEELRAWTRLGPDFWNRQKSRDPEPYHTPALGAVWYEKKEFVDRAMELVPSASVFIWCDAGCVRDDTSEIAMRDFGLRGGSLNDNTMHLARVCTAPVRPFYRAPYRCLAGGYQAGTRSAWKLHSEHYDHMLARYDTAGECCMSDQYIIKSCVDAQPALYTLHDPGRHEHPWFFFLSRI